MFKRSSILLILLIVACSCSKGDKHAGAKGLSAMSITVTSSAFKQGASIPSKYTCDGQDISPELEWTKGPDKTASYALIVDDPDAPKGTFTHWVLFNLPPDETKLWEGMPKSGILPNKAEQGTNDAGAIGYFGPCPPSGTHRYRFKVFALDVMLGMKNSVKVADLDKAMKGHVLAHGELMGTYSKK